MTEPLLIALGLGLAVFLLAFSRILTAEAKRALDVHFVQLKAMKLRNEYAETILALRPPVKEGASGTDADPIEVSPIDESPEQPASRAA